MLVKIMIGMVLGSLILVAQPFQVMTIFPTEVQSGSATLRGVVANYGQATQCMFNVVSNGTTLPQQPWIAVPATTSGATAMADVSNVAQSIAGLPTNATVTATLECIPPGNSTPVVGSSYTFNTATGTGTGSGSGATTTLLPPTFSLSNIVVMGNLNTLGNTTGTVSPYAIVTIFGGNLALQSITAPTTGYPTTLGGTTVTFDGLPGYLISVSPTQLVVLVPPGIPAPLAMNVTVTVDPGNGNTPLSTSVLVQSEQSSPGVTGYVDSFGNDLSIGEVLHTTQGVWKLSVYGTGFGLASISNPGQPAPANPPAHLANQLTAYFTGSDNELWVVQVTFAGLAPGQIGINQINVQIPIGRIPTGPGKLQITTADGRSVILPVNLGS